jgi:hypothetical protein
MWSANRDVRFVPKADIVRQRFCKWIAASAQQKFYAEVMSHLKCAYQAVMDCGLPAHPAAKPLI